MRKGIYCLEGMWSSSISDKSTVSPILELLERASVCKHIYHACGTKEELCFMLERYKSQAIQKAYPIVYFAFHGQKEKILVNKKHALTLEDLGDMLEGYCIGKVFFFASCETLNVDERRIKAMLAKTGAIAAIGYKSEVDWMLATAFELLVLDALQTDKFDWRGIQKIKERILSEYGKLDKLLKFRMIINDRMHFPRKRK